MRQVVLDTETTGIGHENGHRIIEIGCIEMIERKLTENRFHVYLNPEREVEEGAFRVHGISNDFLKDKPLFKDIASDLMQFISDSELIIHNAVFDVGFINAELKLINWPSRLEEHCCVFDSLIFARSKHPGQRNSLDALCKRYEIDNSNRQLHGALKDAEILASVYLAMTGGQAVLFENETESSYAMNPPSLLPSEIVVCNTPILLANEEELVRHEAFINFLIKKSGNNLWNKHSTESENQ